MNSEINQQKSKNWHIQTVPEIEKTLNTSKKKGLAKEEARKRLDEFGTNELQKEEKRSMIIEFLVEFKDPLLIILIAAAILSLIVKWGHANYEAVIIFVIVFLNALFTFIQKGRADAALAKLKEIAAPETHIIRSGEEAVIKAVEVVPGDLLVLNEGDRVPADARVVESVNLKTVESSLTGESLPVTKISDPVKETETVLADRKNMVYASTTVAYGRGSAIVTETGMRTEIGRIAELIGSVQETDTPLQKDLKKFSTRIGQLILIICAFLFLITGPISNPNDPDIWLVQLIAAIALAVAAIPEGLPTVVTTTLALGVGRMSKRNAIIKKLHAVETLGCTTVICTDKTGTLTKNEMTVQAIWTALGTYDVTGTGYAPEGEIRRGSDVLVAADHQDLEMVLRIGVLCNNARLAVEVHKENSKWIAYGDPTEACLIPVARKAGIDPESYMQTFACVHEFPFDSTRKRMATVHQVDGNYHAYVKGAVESLLERSNKILKDGKVESLSSVEKTKILEIYGNFADQALRGLGFAYRPLDDPLADMETVENDLIFAGMQFIIDPPRDEVRDAIQKAHDAGVVVKMITGDNAITARAIARDLGIIKESEKVREGKEIDALSADQIVDTNVFARVTPEHKQVVVNALQAKDNVVAMTGDGVNDAPALKSADVGVAMGITGTDVSKEAASMVLADDNFATIVNAVEEGRGIYDNIKKFILYMLSTNIVEVIILIVATLAGYPTPLVATQILFINLIIDGPPAISLGFDAYDPDIMKRPPRSTSEPILKPNFLKIMATRAVVLSAWVLLIFWIHEIPGSIFSEVDMTFEEATTQLPWLHNYEVEYIGETVTVEEWNFLYRTWKARSVVFLLIICSEIANVFNCRSETRTLFDRDFFSNRSLNYSVLGLGVLVVLLYIPGSPFGAVFSVVPLGWYDFLLIIPTVLLVWIPVEIVKVTLRRKST